MRAPRFSIALAPSSQRLLLAIVGVFVLALALRWAHLLALRESLSATRIFALARGDAAYHWREAQRILDGDFWLRGAPPWKGPGYSYFLAALMTVFGRGPDILRWPLAFLGAANCAALVVLARRLMPLSWATLAGALAATNGLLILFDAELFFPTPLITLSLLALWWLGAARRPRGTQILAGIALGWAALIHPVYLLCAAFLAFWLWRTDGRRAAYFVVAFGLAIAPVTLENVLVRGQPVLISTSGGINLYLGNQPSFQQTGGQRTSAWDRLLNTPQDMGIDSESARDRFFWRVAAREALRHPLRQAGLLLRKLGVLLSPIEIANNFRLYELREHSWVLHLFLGKIGRFAWPWGVSSALGLAGLPLLWRKRDPASRTLLLWMASLSASMLLAFVTARYRAPLAFFLCLPAAALLHEIVHHSREGQRWTGLRWIAAALGTMLVVVALAAPQRQFPPPLEWSEAQVHEAEGDRGGAQRWFEQALRRYPGEPVLLLEASAFHARGGRRDLERALLQRVIDWPDLEPDLYVVALERRARSLRVDDRLELAAKDVERALALHPDHARYHGKPFFWLPAPPVTACRLRLLLAGIVLRQGGFERAQDLVEQVRGECGNRGRLHNPLRELELQLRSRGQP